MPVNVAASFFEWLKPPRERRTGISTSDSTPLPSAQSRVARMKAADASISLDLIVRSLLALGASAAELGRVIARAA